MNYGKRMITRKRNALISRSSMMGKKANVSVIRLILLGVIALTVTISCAGIGSLQGVLANAPRAEDVDIMPLGYATFLYDYQGNQLRKLAAPSANRLPVSIDQIPLNLQHAVVAIEDERFYEHNGVDVRGILRAAVRALTSHSFSEGASTITQQLLKNNVFTNWTNESTLVESFTRKLQEQYLAVQIEKKIQDKNVILENYLNTINLGAGAYGVQAASRQYFNKDVWKLNLSECAVLAGITQNPTQFNPIVYPEENAKRRQFVLDYMLEQGYITQEEHDEALKDDVYTRIQEAQEVVSSETNSVYSYFEDELTDQVVNDLMSIKGYTRTQATNLLYSGGLKIMTTQDPTIQAILDEEYSNESNYPSIVQYELDYALTIEDDQGDLTNYSKEMMMLYFQAEDPSFDLLFDTVVEGQTYVERYRTAVLANGGEIFSERINFVPQPQSSMSVIDQHTGYVKAIVGGRGEKTASLTLNRATDSTRQPGSTFKIVSTYAPALNEKGMSLATTYEDKLVHYPSGEPVNNAWMSFSGTTTLRKAIQNSVNTVAFQVFQDVTPELGLKYLDAFGFTTLAHGTEADTDAYGNVYTDATLATCLGGITYGVTNVELCAAYACIANEGNYIKPIYYTRIYDHNDNVLIENTSVERSVIRDSTAWLLTSAMMDVVEKGTGTACKLDINMPVAGKTGTTEDYNDLWFVGYTPYYTCAVWSGYDNNAELPEYARNFHQGLWKKVMTRIHSGLPAATFSMPPSVQQASVCSITGMLPDYSCPTITEYFEGVTIPINYCYGHGDTYDDNLDDYYEYNDTGSTHNTPSGQISNSDSSTTDPIGIPNPDDWDYVTEGGDLSWDVQGSESGFDVDGEFAIG
ncbi:MAG: transglycosylase domain-containing protein [Blautia sp.]|nr:transglycosylase domain-containing protein [Blautia sp.]